MIHKHKAWKHLNPHKISTRRWRHMVRPGVREFFKSLSPVVREGLRRYHAFLWFTLHNRFKYKHAEIRPAPQRKHIWEVSLYDPDGYDMGKTCELMGLADYTLNPWPFFTLCAKANSTDDAKWKIFETYIRCNHMKSMPCFIPETLLGVRDNEIYDRIHMRGQHV